MPTLTPKCNLEVAEKMLEDEEMNDLINQLNRGVCERVPDKIINGDQSEEIWAAVTDIRAAGIMKKALKVSREPDKIILFLMGVEKVQRQHAESMSKIHQKYIDAHRCHLCLGELPKVPTEEPAPDKKPTLKPTETHQN